jgi:cytochrome c553
MPERRVSKTPIAQCELDHRGQGNDPFPRLAGQHADYLVKQLVVFQRTDQRPTAAAMKIVEHELSGQEIESVAACVHALP